MTEIQAPTAENLFGEEAVRLGRDWPTEHDDTTYLKRGYYRRDDGSLGKVVNGIKLSESEDDYSSSHSAKRAKMNYCASESDSVDDEVEGVKNASSTTGEEGDTGVDEAKDEEKDEERDEEKDEERDEEEDEEEDENGERGDAGEEDDESDSYIFQNICRQTVGYDDDGNGEECGGETDGCSQMCHSCKQAMKRGFFAYGFMR